MAAEKKTKTQIIRAIVKLVSERPLSMYELAKELNSNWDTIKNNVELLKELKIVGISEQKVYLQKDSLLSFQEDTIAGLPLSDEMRKRIYALAKKITDAYVKETGKQPNNTQLQKSLVEIAEKFPNMRIPCGWYFYGKVVMVKVDKNKFTSDLDGYDFKSLTIDLKKLEEEIVRVTKKISRMSTAALKDRQYAMHGKNDYVIKRDIEKILLSKEMDKEEFFNLLYKLIFHFRIIKDDEFNLKVIGIIKEAISMMILKTAACDSADKEECRLLLIEAFNAFWKVYATYDLYVSLEGDLGYDKRRIRSIFEDRINFYANDLADHFTTFDAMGSG